MLPFDAIILIRQSNLCIGIIVCLCCLAGLFVMYMFVHCVHMYSCCTLNVKLTCDAQ